VPVYEIEQLPSINGICFAFFSVQFLCWFKTLLYLYWISAEEVSDRSRFVSLCSMIQLQAFFSSQEYLRYTFPKFSKAYKES